MSDFETEAGVDITETVTDSGDYSFMWSESHGIAGDEIEIDFELLYVPRDQKWLRYCWPGGRSGGSNSLLWPWERVKDMDEARELVRQRVGRA